jgi:hypothetical protein
VPQKIKVLVWQRSTKIIAHAEVAISTVLVMKED